MSSSNFRPDIEGLRGVAILLVVLYHAGVPGFSGGYIGVDVFFVLSGYLITRIVAGEVAREGRLDLLRFYGRRGRRLLPAASLMVVTTTALAYFLFSPLEQDTLTKSALSTSIYVSNVFFGRRATDYLAGAADSNPLLHTWSLSVEEQFYLAWPLLLALTLRSRPRRLPAVMGSVLIGSLVLCVWLTQVRQPWAFFLAPSRAWEFAAGGLGAMLPMRRRSASLGMAGLAGIGLAAIVFDEGTAFPGFAAIIPVAATVCVLRAEGAGGGPILQTRLMQVVGRWSYSWYLWHWPALVFSESVFGELTLGARLAVLAGALGLSAASYKFLEVPVRFSPRLTNRPLRSVGLAFALTAFGVVVAFCGRMFAEAGQRSASQTLYAAALEDLPSLYADGCPATFYETEPRECVDGVAGASTVAIFGDSHAAMWYPAIHIAAQEYGWRTVTLLKEACPAADIGAYHNSALGRPYTECPAWRKRVFESLTQDAPEIVIMSSSSAYVSDFGVTKDEWLRGTIRTAERLAAHSSVVILVDPPQPGFHATYCLSRAAWRESWLGPRSCRFKPRESIAGALERAVARQVEGVHVIDLGRSVCPTTPCEVQRDGRVVYRDSNHLSASFAATLGPELGRRIRALVDVGSQNRDSPR